MKKLGVLLAVILILTASLSPAPAVAQDPDFDIAGGHFYTQANGQGGAGGTGYRITDEGGIPLWTQFKAIGGVSRVGYVSSQRFDYKGFTNQGTQKYVLQWQGAAGLFFLNVFDELHAAGKDEFLESVRSIPRPATFNEEGKTFAQITSERLALLDAAPAIKAKYMSSADPVKDHGLPTTAVTDVGPALVIRNQRDAMQLWKVDMPFARAGEVTIVNGGDIFKEVGLIPGNAATPENAPGTTPAPTPTVPAPTPTTVPPTAVPTAPPAPQFQYNPAGLTWLPNCGLVEIRVFVRDAGSSPVNNVRVFVQSSGPWNTISVPTGQEGRDPGWTNVVLRTDPVNEPWKVWVIDDSGNQVSPAVDVVSDTKSCEPSGTGHQVATVTFAKGGAPVAEVIQPQPATPAQPPVAGTLPAPASGAFPFVLGGISWQPNCGMSQVKVKVVDPSGSPKDGLLVHIESGDSTWQATSRKTGSEGFESGFTDFFLREEPVAETWRVWMVGPNGERLSDTVFVPTDTGPCLPDQEGHQVATVSFQQVGQIVETPRTFGINSSAVSWAANCTQTQLNVRLRDKAGNPINGVRFRVETDGLTWQVDSLPTGNTDQGPGWTNIWVRDEPFSVRLNLFAITKDGDPISNTLVVDTDDVNCSSTGHQVATIDFVQS